MGTTVVCLFFSPDQPDRAIALHAGDSRVYRYRGRKLEQLTEDHSIAGSLGVDESTLHPFMQGVITRAVGIQADLELEETEVEVKPGDLFIVCSDGLTRMLNDRTLARIIRANRAKMEALVQAMVTEANQAGGYDNITLIAVQVGED